MVAMVASNSTPLGRSSRRPVQRVGRRLTHSPDGRKLFQIPVGSATTRTLLNSFYPDEDFRRKSPMNLPLVLFCLLILLCLAGVLWSMRQ